MTTGERAKRATMRLYGEIRRVSGDDERMVWGYASTDQMAADGQIIALGALRDALDDYMAFANIREMHQLSAVGTAREAEVDDGGLYVGAWVQDDDAWDKVKTGVYRGFSIGARVTARDPLDAKVITALTLNEISLVDRPADPGAVFDVFRAATNEQDPSMSEANTTDPKDAGTDPAVDVDAASAPAGAVEGPSDVVEHASGGAAALGGSATGDVPEGAVARAVAAAATAQETLSSALDRATVAHPAPVAPLPGAEIRRGLCTVNQLGWMLSELAYLVQDADLESAIEGDDSPVPAQLRDALLALAKAYRAMSDEEIKELLANVDVDVSLENGIIQLAVAGADVERAAGQTIGAESGTRLQSALDGLIARGFQPKVGKVVELLTGERDTLLRTMTGMTDAMTAMAARVAKLEATPMPAKTAGPAAVASGSAVSRAVGKGEDASAQPEGTALSEDDVKRALEAMPAEERAMLLTRAALARPFQITR